MQIRLDHAVIHVSDWRRSNDFYRRVLGAELIGETDGPCRYRFGEQQLNVHGQGVDPYPVARLPVEPGNSDLCFEWEGPIEEAVARYMNVTYNVDPNRIKVVGMGSSQPLPPLPNESDRAYQYRLPRVEVSLLADAF